MSSQISGWSRQVPPASGAHARVPSQKSPLAHGSQISGDPAARVPHPSSPGRATAAAHAGTATGAHRPAGPVGRRAPGSAVGRRAPGSTDAAVPPSRRHRCRGPSRRRCCRGARGRPMSSKMSSPRQPPISEMTPMNPRMPAMSSLARPVPVTREPFMCGFMFVPRPSEGLRLAGAGSGFSPESAGPTSFLRCIRPPDQQHRPARPREGRERSRPSGPLLASIGILKRRPSVSYLDFGAGLTTLRRS